MTDRRDPVEQGSDGTRDLYDVSTWEQRTWLDGLAVSVYRLIVTTARVFIVLLALLILLSQLALIAVATTSQPFVGVFSLLSVVPALAIAAYIWYTDVTLNEPLVLLVFTFLLGVLFAGFAALINSLAQGFFEAIPLVGMALFFYLIVAPIEETVKWLAVRLGAYNSSKFDAVIDGAVYGAMAGLGFATIENALYISQQYVNASQQGLQVLDATAGTAALRTFAGPGHVIYSAFAGYYLGLAKFNRENRGPIIIKGLLIAAFIHATYNTLVTYLPAVVQFTPAAGTPYPIVFIAFVFIYDGIFGYFLYRKLSRYRAAYHDARSTSSGIAFDSEDVDERNSSSPRSSPSHEDADEETSPNPRSPSTREDADESAEVGPDGPD